MPTDPDIKHHEKEYADARPLYKSLTERVKNLLADLLEKEGLPYAQIECRAKDIKSFLEKIDRKGFKNPLNQMMDLAGIRVITYYPDDANKLAEIIRQEFEVDEENSTDKYEDLGVDRFGYLSIHLVCRIGPKRNTLADWSKL